VSRKLELNLDGVVVTASLLADAAPRTVQALLKACPLTGTSHHARWSGPAFNLITKIEELQGVPSENPRHLLTPGTIVWIPQNSELLAAYGDVCLCNGPAQELFGSVVAEVDDDLGPLRVKAHSLRLEGEKPISIRAI
jgi:Protein of unknown function (DUF3830)